MRLVADPAADLDLPRWSPDGKWIAFRSKRGDNYDVEVARGDGRNRTRLTTGPAYDGSLSWSPDGSRIAFISDREGFDALYVVRPPDTAAKRLTAYPALDPQWSR